MAQFIIFSLLMLLAGFANAQAPQGSVVWPASGSDSEIKEHFVYGLAEAKNGAILAFAEGRIRPGDASAHHIVLKRSEDGGSTWSASKIIVRSTAGACFANPTPVVDRRGGIHLFYAQNFHNDSSHLYKIVSRNHGKTWSAPVELTHLFADDPLQRPFHLPGPGHGVVLKNGRLLVQVWHRRSIKYERSQRAYGVSVLISDDHGLSWENGNYVPAADSLEGNESRLVALKNGSVLMNARPSGSARAQRRLFSWSEDNGFTWSSWHEGSMGPLPVVDMGFNVTTVKHQSYLLSSFPEGPGRHNMVLQASADNGHSWLKRYLIREGVVNYSDIAVLKDGSILILYGRGTSKEVIACRLSKQLLRTQVIAH
ncbi:sialidase family protein [Niabella insulamsoli]|uniref:sialidase family protein n=1 Tax=Niabella insulamsoli TaxID=3144874 RepID=UPI0031FD954B